MYADKLDEFVYAVEATQGRDAAFIAEGYDFASLREWRDRNAVALKTGQPVQPLWVDVARKLYVIDRKKIERLNVEIRDDFKLWPEEYRSVFTLTKFATDAFFDDETKYSMALHHAYLAAEIIDGLAEQYRKLADVTEKVEDVRQDEGKTSGNVAGMKWQDAKAKGEQHVKRNNNVFPGLRMLARAVGCSTGTMSKAIDDSTYLKAREAVHKAASSPAGREVQLADDMLAGLSTEDAIKHLAAEQEAEDRREERQHKAARRRT